MWVKICGNTNLEDAQAAAELGADALGFVFAPSLRQVTPVQVGAMAAHLPDRVERIGVFPSGPAGKIVAAAEKANLTGVQLHGNYDPHLSAAIQDALPRHIRLIQAVHWTVGESEKHCDNITNSLEMITTHGRISNILIDSKVDSATGGTGIAFDWKAARTQFARYALILAGGLTPWNIQQAITELQPWGVDVASGVEKSPGKKSHAKLVRFIEGARAARV